ncbi:hypothetical protein NHH03_27625 [Stieleria sp. TO1_6]|uniref:hypothetical protein n=1 Tax=Stieleria tagensis TaxID=2956795 RepID=UPI00209B4AB9|nr:hypothetical protein [Stieleria tagensis]MCO8125540.1 hypothetical protein [Stieleria tagensis]
MKPQTLYHDDDITCCLSFDDGTWLFWREDSPMIIAFPGTEPEPYEEGRAPEIDELMNDPSALYAVADERMDDTRERYVRMVLGLE